MRGRKSKKSCCRKLILFVQTLQHVTHHKRRDNQVQVQVQHQPAYVQINQRPFQLSIIKTTPA